MEKIRHWVKSNQRFAALVSVVIGSIGLCAVSIFAALLMSTDNLAQSIYMLAIFLPSSATIIGILTRIYIRKLWVAPIIAVVSIGMTMLMMFRGASLIYLIIYAGLSLFGYLMAHLFK